ncbi:unnamed protein product [Spirodela intermedia]|uniref:Uncharacterized protein n=1 Tax=Spirodela intermedia TaxID=51605 RepID=A0A7I8IKP7_SPIIN|nr:unnamed protein product [Spirodela intermedia]CAA6658451.1 unnamed protein product [Spirodela intermedia]
MVAEVVFADERWDLQSRCGDQNSSSSSSFWWKLFSPSFRFSAGESRRFSSGHRPAPPAAAPKPSSSRPHRRRNGSLRRKSAPPQSKASSPDALLQNISAIIAPEGENLLILRYAPRRWERKKKVGSPTMGLKFAGECSTECSCGPFPGALVGGGRRGGRSRCQPDGAEDHCHRPLRRRRGGGGHGGASRERRRGAHGGGGGDGGEEMLQGWRRRPQILSWARRQPGFRHTTATYNAMLYIAGEAREFDLVDELLRWMEEDSCPTDVKTWTILVHHFGRGNKVGRALWAFEQTKKCRSGPDKMAYGSIIRALCDAGKAEMAVEFYREMAGGGMFPVCGDLYQALMTALAASGDVTTARSIGEDMAKASDAASSSTSLMLKSFCISGNLEAAMALAEEMRTKTQRLDPEKVEILAVALCKAGRVSEALELVTGAEKNGLAMKFLRRCSPGVRTYTELIQHLSRAGEHGMACELYDEMVANGAEPDMVAVVAMAAGHVQNGRVGEAWSLFEGMKKKEKGTKPTRKAYSVFIRELCKSGEPEEALRALAEMLRSDLAPPGGDIFHLLCNSLREKGLPEKASMVEQMRLGLSSTIEDAAEDLDPSQNQSQGGRRWSDDELKEVERILASPCSDWASMAEGLRKSGILFSPELAEEVLQRCRGHGGAALRFFSWVGKSAGFRHTARAYNLAIKIAGAGKDFSFMRHLHEEMKRKGCPRMVDTWTTMIAQYGRAGLTEMALGKFAEMKSEGFRPDASTFKFLIIFLCGKKGRKVAEAEKTFHEMLSAGISPDKELAGSFLSCLCESGKISEARSCVEALITRGFGAQVGFSLLVKSLCRVGRMEEALELVGETGSAVAHRGCRADEFVYGSLIHGLLRGGREAAALEKIEEMKRAGIPATAQVYTSLMVHFFREKRPEKAMAVLEKMEEEGCEPTVVTFSALIRGYVGTGMVAAAWAIFRRMAAAGAPPDFQTYSTFMACLCRAGRSEEAMELIQEMAARGISPSAVNFRTVFYGLNREGKHDLARALLEKKWTFSRKRRFLA